MLKGKPYREAHAVKYLSEGSRLIFTIIEGTCQVKNGTYTWIDNYQEFSRAYRIVDGKLQIFSDGISDERLSLNIEEDFSNYLGNSSSIIGSWPMAISLHARHQ